MAYKTMTLGECKKYDHEMNLKGQLTGWGIVSKIRREKGISRKAVRLLKKAKENN